MGNYIPKPRDLSHVQLPDEVAALAEVLSENTHEMWAQLRVTEGWTYGEMRNETLKQHPGLVPYDELDEEEKAYDRATALSAIKFILAEGFEISRRKEA